MNCAEQTRLMIQFERTARAYAEAVAGMRDLHGYDLIAQQRLVTHIREACDGAQVALAEHLQSHGCVHAAIREPLVESVT